MIKAFLAIKGGMFPIQIRRRTVKYLLAAMYNETPIQRFKRRIRYFFTKKEKK